MAGKALAFPETTSHLQFWERFQTLAQMRVREGNALAGEQVWVTATAAEPLPQLTVRWAARSDDSVECQFDPERGILTCRPGADLQVRTCEFQVVSGTAGVVRGAGGELTLDEVLTVIFDELQWVDER